MNGIILLNKEPGMTSQTAVTIVKRLLHVSKVGHAGTLDPMATGLLVILLGDATKISDYLLHDDKTYDCEIILGEATTTEDNTGDIVEKKEVNEISQVDEVLHSLIGPIKQVPPMYSSVHHQGRKLYQFARENVIVERSERDAVIHEIKRTSSVLVDDGKAHFYFQARVSKGTYLRTLCVEIGKRLQLPAHMGNLKRIQSGDYHLKDAFTLSQIEKNDYQLISVLEALKRFPIYHLSQAEFNAVDNGHPIALDHSSDLLVLAWKNEIKAIYEKTENIYKAKRVWK